MKGIYYVDGSGNYVSPPQQRTTPTSQNIEDQLKEIRDELRKERIAQTPQSTESLLKEIMKELRKVNRKLDKIFDRVTKASSAIITHEREQL